MSDHVVSLEIILKVLGMEKETRNKTNKGKNKAFNKAVHV